MTEKYNWQWWRYIHIKHNTSSTVCHYRQPFRLMRTHWYLIVTLRPTCVLLQNLYYHMLELAFCDMHNPNCPDVLAKLSFRSHCNIFLEQPQSCKASFFATRLSSRFMCVRVLICQLMSLSFSFSPTFLPSQRQYMQNAPLAHGTGRGTPAASPNKARQAQSVRDNVKLIVNFRAHLRHSTSWASMASGTGVP